MSHTAEQHRKKHEARAEASHHHKNSAVDGAHHDMPMAERIYTDKMSEKSEDKE